MKNNALSVANYLIDVAERHNSSLQPLKLMKLVYIAYGFGLAILDKSIIDYRFDKVEAWKFGPVIPSVYHSFKSYGKGNVSKTNMIIDEFGDTSIPELEDDDVKLVCDFVWKKYGEVYSGSELVDLLHSKGTPWWMAYREGMNNPIPESITKRYYTEVYNRMLENAREETGRS